jgi:hypothetical protein
MIGLCHDILKERMLSTCSEIPVIKREFEILSVPC